MPPGGQFLPLDSRYRPFDGRFQPPRRSIPRPALPARIVSHFRRPGKDLQSNRSAIAQSSGRKSRLDLGITRQNSKQSWSLSKLSLIFMIREKVRLMEFDETKSDYGVSSNFYLTSSKQTEHVFRGFDENTLICRISSNSGLYAKKKDRARVALSPVSSTESPKHA